MPRPRPSVAVLYPPSGTRWTGQIGGLYVRVSSASQTGNDSVAFQENLVNWLHSQAHAVAVYNEEGQSATKGFKRGGQKYAQSLLADLEAGALDFIATAHIDRLTREHTGGDAATIKRAASRARAPIVTPSKTYRVWVLSDEQAFDLDIGIARLDAKARRNNIYRGIAAAIANRPVFRQRITYGYRFEYQRTHRPACEQTTRCDCPIALDGKGRAVRRWWIKDKAAAPYLAELEEAAERMPTATALLAYLNRAARPAEWIASGRIWKIRDLETFWSNPAYGGRWLAVRNPSEETDVWSQYLAHYDPVGHIVHEVPELAYWTPVQIANWRKTFLDKRSTYPRGHIAHPYLGVLQCFSCGSTMQSSGRDGYRCHNFTLGHLPYRHPEHDPRTCETPQLLGHKSVERAFLAHLPIAVAELKSDAETIARCIGVTPLLDELRNISEQMTRLRSDWGRLHMPSQARARLSQLHLDLAATERRIAECTERRQLFENTRELIELTRRNAKALSTWHCDDPERSAKVAAVVCALYGTARIERFGPPNRGARFAVADYTLVPISI